MILTHRDSQGASKRLKETRMDDAATAIALVARKIDCLPTVVLVAILEFVAHHDLHTAELTCRALRVATTSGGLWEKLALRRATLCDEDVPRTEFEWKQLACLVALPTDRDLRLLQDVTACSSVDRSVESPTNTLEPSRCWLAMRSSTNRSNPTITEDAAKLAQIECGCETGEACYWSSSPSTDQNCRDFIDYIVFDKSVVSRLQIIPYRAYWHPEIPTYAPMAVSVSFYAHEPNTGSVCGSPKVLLYQSPVYHVANDMRLQEFKLPKRVWLPHGAIMRLNLMGRHQAETFGLPAWVPAEDQVPQYYSCLSFVNAVGVNAMPRDELDRQRPVFS